MQFFNESFSVTVMVQKSFYWGKLNALVDFQYNFNYHLKCSNFQKLIVLIFKILKLISKIFM